MPVALATEHVCPAGWVKTVTLYAPLFDAGVLKMNVVALAATVRLSARLFCRSSPEAVSPAIVPPMVWVTGGGEEVDELPMLPPPQAERQSEARNSRNTRNFRLPSVPRVWA